MIIPPKFLVKTIPLYSGGDVSTPLYSNKLSYKKSIFYSFKISSELEIDKS